MRTTKRFSPKVLGMFEAKGRGKGTGVDFVPWHRVSRSDPASSGRSHLIPSHIGRHLELLSDVERDTLLFATMYPQVVDIREQFPLAQSTAIHELAEYDVKYSGLTGPGTLDIARGVGVKHPVVRGDDTTANWRMTTDFLLVIDDAGTKRLLAISTKPSSDLKRRALELLWMEKKYWQARTVDWLLITPDQFDSRAAACIVRAWPWALLSERKALAPRHLSAVRAREGQPIRELLGWLGNQLGDLSTAQAAFWQAVWTGALPLDLRRGWRPHEPVRFLSADAFAALNPIWDRRSAWSLNTTTFSESLMAAARVSTASFS